MDLTILGTFIGLALIGGLAIFCFTKVFSIVFLGTPRTEAPHHAHEVEVSMLVPKIMAGLLIILIGFVPATFVGPVARVTEMFSGNTELINQTTSILSLISMGSVLFIGLIMVLWVIRSIQQKKVTVIAGPTWGCAYTGADPCRHQYTASSYAENYREIVGVVANVKKHYTAIHEDDIFPGPRKFESHNRDFLEDNLVIRPINFLTTWMERSAILQTGKLQHYVLYALVFLIAIFLLTFFRLI